MRGARQRRPQGNSGVASPPLQTGAARTENGGLARPGESDVNSAICHRGRPPLAREAHLRRQRTLRRRPRLVHRQDGQVPATRVTQRVELREPEIQRLTRRWRHGLGRPSRQRPARRKARTRWGWEGCCFDGIERRAGTTQPTGAGGAADAAVEGNLNPLSPEGQASQQREVASSRATRQDGPCLGEELIDARCRRDPSDDTPGLRSASSIGVNRPPALASTRP